MAGCPMEKRPGALLKDRFLRDMEKWIVKVMDDVNVNAIHQILDDCQPSKPIKMKVVRNLVTAMRDSVVPVMISNLDEGLVEDEIEKKFELLSELKKKYSGCPPAKRPPLDPRQFTNNIKTAARQKALDQLEMMLSARKMRMSEGFRTINYHRSVDFASIGDLMQKYISAEDKCNDCIETISIVDQEIDVENEKFLEKND